MESVEDIGEDLDADSMTLDEDESSPKSTSVPKNLPIDTTTETFSLSDFLHTQGANFADDCDEFETVIKKDANGKFYMDKIPKVKGDSPLKDVFQEKAKFEFRKPTKANKQKKGKVSRKKTNTKSSPKGKKVKKNVQPETDHQERQDCELGNLDSLPSDKAQEEGDGENGSQKENKGGRTALSFGDWARRMEEVWEFLEAKGNRPMKEMKKPAHWTQTYWDWIKRNANKCKLQDGNLMWEKKTKDGDKGKSTLLRVCFHWTLGVACHQAVLCSCSLGRGDS
jgi:hypothetical protein